MMFKIVIKGLIIYVEMLVQSLIFKRCLTHLIRIALIKDMVFAEISYLRTLNEFFMIDLGPIYAKDPLFSPSSSPFLTN